jgi:hypothetical protein
MFITLCVSCFGVPFVEDDGLQDAVTQQGDSAVSLRMTSAFVSERCGMMVHAWCSQGVEQVQFVLEDVAYYALRMAQVVVDGHLDRSMDD